MCQGMCMEVTRQPAGVSSFPPGKSQVELKLSRNYLSSLITEPSHQPPKTSGERMLDQNLKLNEGNSKLCSYAKQSKARTGKNSMFLQPGERSEHKRKQMQENRKRGHLQQAGTKKMH